MTIAAAGVSMPSFWLGIMLLLIFALHLNLRAGGGPAADWQVLILPAIALGFSAAAIIARLVRSSLVEAMQQDYVRTARAKGLQERAVVVRHALKNALIPVVTVVRAPVRQPAGRERSSSRPSSPVPGSGTLPSTASWSGISRSCRAWCWSRPSTYVLANFLVDVSYTWLDPRIRFGGGA